MWSPCTGSSTCLPGSPPSPARRSCCWSTTCSPARAAAAAGHVAGPAGTRAGKRTGLTRSMREPPSRARGDALDTPHRHVNDVLDELVVQRRMTVQQTVVERTVDQVECHLDVRVRGDLPAAGGALEDGPGLVP